jgi:hypothetical protein
MKRTTKDIFGLTAGSVGLATGAKVVSSVGVEGMPGLAGGFTSAAALMPTIGTLIGARQVIGLTQGLNKKGRRRIL